MIAFLFRRCVKSSRPETYLSLCDSFQSYTVYIPVYLTNRVLTKKTVITKTPSDRIWVLTPLKLLRLHPNKLPCWTHGPGHDTNLIKYFSTCEKHCSWFTASLKVFKFNPIKTKGPLETILFLTLVYVTAQSITKARNPGAQCFVAPIFWGKPEPHCSYVSHACILK